MHAFPFSELISNIADCAILSVLAIVCTPRSCLLVILAHYRFVLCGFKLKVFRLIGPLHMSPASGTNFVFCSYGKFNPGYRDEKCPNGPQNIRGTVFRRVSDLTSHPQLNGI